ncbi:MAG: Mur ligase family protein [Candidatus Electryoneaceae bacterium]|nr:Mur ligase family protein [Candidatus Electryoneaceae bacterium]
MKQSYCTGSSSTPFADSTVSKFHFIGICGVAMASVAAELKRSGFTVTGSDSGFYPPMSVFLEEQGVPVMQGFHPDNPPADALIVVGNALSRGNEELEAVLDRRLGLISLPELIARRYLTSNIGSPDGLNNDHIRRRSVVVTGTHGKTTTTTMLAHILRENGRNPGWMVGGIPMDLPVPCEFGSGSEFVIEGDEYDTVYYDKRPKFLHYRPTFAILNSVEFDHADIYADFSAIDAAFRRFVRLLPRSGRLIVNGDDPNSMSIAEDSLCPTVTFGTGEHCQWRLESVSSNVGQIRSPRTGISGCDESSVGGRVLPMKIQMLGQHNLLNGLAAVATACEIGVDVLDALKALETFRGVVRRLELVIQSDELTIYDDFAHHPTAVEAALSAVRQRHPEQRIWALFEPRSYSMTKRIFMKPLTEALQKADCVVLGKVHRQERIPETERLDRRFVIDELRKSGVEAYIGGDAEEIIQLIDEHRRSNDVLVIMSNGGFGGLKQLLKRFVD